MLSASLNKTLHVLNYKMAGIGGGGGGSQLFLKFNKNNVLSLLLVCKIVYVLALDIVSTF